MQYGSADYQPVFYYDYTTGGGFEHHLGTVRSILDFMGDDSYASSGEGLAFFFEELFDIDPGQDRAGQLTLEKRVFLVPTGLPTTVFTGRKSGYLNVEERFASSVQTTHWVETNKYSTMGMRYHNVATSGADLGTLGDYEQWITFDRGDWGGFTDFYRYKYAGHKDRFKTYRTMLVFRAKYDTDEHGDFGLDPVLESFASRGGAYEGVSDIYEVFYTAVCSPLLFTDQVLQYNTDTKVFYDAAGSYSSADETIPTHPQSMEIEDPFGNFEDLTSTDVSGGGWTEGEGGEGHLGLMEIAFHPGEGVNEEGGPGVTYGQEYNYTDADLRTEIAVRYQIQEGNQFAVKEVHENFFGALTTQLVALVGWDTIPRAYATKMQGSRPIRPDLLSSMASEGMTTTTPTSAPVATTTTMTTGGSY